MVQNLFLSGLGMPPGCPSMPPKYVLFVRNPIFPKVVRPPKDCVTNCVIRAFWVCDESL